MKLKILMVLLITNFYLYGGTKTVSIDFELSETSINRAIVSQFDDPNFIFQHFTGTFEFSPGLIIPYDIQLDRPTIVFGTESLGINLSFHISLDSLGIEYEIDVTPSLTINDQSIRASEVVAFIDNLDELINENDEIPETVRILLIGLYNEYEPQIYASNLFNSVLEEINSNDFFSQRAISITDFGVNTSFQNGKFVLAILAEITYGSTSFYAYVDPGSNSIKFGSNIKCSIKRLFFYTDLGYNEFYGNDNLNLQMNYNPNYSFNYFAQLNLSDFANQSIYVIYALFETNETFYYNKFVLHSYNWEQPNIRINY